LRDPAQSGSHRAVWRVVPRFTLLPCVREYNPNVLGGEEMTNALIDVHAPGCAGNYFDGHYKCPNCGECIQFTTQNRTSGVSSEAVCARCGRAIELRWRREGGTNARLDAKY
jgi:hypothetical protein